MPIPAAILARDDVFFKAPVHLTLPEAQARFLAIAHRNPAVLGGLLCGVPMWRDWYIEDKNRIFSQEWGLAREATVINPDCILVAGRGDGVTWGPFLTAGLVPMAHSHPYHEKIATSRALPVGGVTWAQIAGGPVPQLLNARLLVFPSAGDFAFCAAANMAVHTVFTPYAVVGPAGAFRIVNPNEPGVTAQTPRLGFQLAGVQWINDGHYRGTLTALRHTQQFWYKKGITIFGGGGAGINL
ncbi:MAG: hypothetical protein ABJC74_11055 [Gemmatimonadota bacterium]